MGVVGGARAEMVVDCPQRRLAVDVVGVRHPERAADHGSCCGDGLGRAGDRWLADEFDGERGGPPGPDVVLHLGADLLAHDEDDAVEPAGCGVSRRIIHDGLVVRPDRGELLQAPVAAAVPSREDDELHRGILSRDHAAVVGTGRERTGRRDGDHR